jgi:hypothetical protein
VAPVSVVFYVYSVGEERDLYGFLLDLSYHMILNHGSENQYGNCSIRQIHLFWLFIKELGKEHSIGLCIYLLDVL